MAFAGDWHANEVFAVQAVEAAIEGGAEALVHVGDFGYLFEPEYLDALDAALGEVSLYFVDGNHEDFDVLAAQPLDERGLRPLSARVTHLPRGHRWTWAGHTWLALGGAHSVDRQNRVAGRSWWPAETISRGDITRARTGGPCDVMVSHDAPAGYEIPFSYLPGTFPVSEERESHLHRHRVGEVARSVTPRLLVHGHHHLHYTTTWHHTAVVGLSHDRAGSIPGNLAWLDTATLRFVEPTRTPPPLEALSTPSPTV